MSSLPQCRLLRAWATIQRENVEQLEVEEVQHPIPVGVEEAENAPQAPDDHSVGQPCDRYGFRIPQSAQLQIIYYIIYRIYYIL